mmetsp:Transcript_1737/g.3706  ORF Transcript_1737/g.3706 Transcript_1737/m.3706 type:complete len:218 (-) Transcript_1737:2024-2677(-)
MYKRSKSCLLVLRFHELHLQTRDLLGKGLAVVPQLFLNCLYSCLSLLCSHQQLKSLLLPHRLALPLRSCCPLLCCLQLLLQRVLFLLQALQLRFERIQVTGGRVCLQLGDLLLLLLDPRPCLLQLRRVLGHRRLPVACQLAVLLQLKLYPHQLVLQSVPLLFHSLGLPRFLNRFLHHLFKFFNHLLLLLYSLRILRKLVFLVLELFDLIVLNRVRFL